MNKHKPINVTKTMLPDINEYFDTLQRVWETGQLSNNGTLVQNLQNKLKEYLGLDNIDLVANGTLALQLAIKALKVEGEVITTPFSYVATTNALLWENCKPIFVDIEEETFNIDANKIEQSITEDTTAILATHVFGHPCNVERIDEIAKKHGLKVIYDAAHAFGVKYNDRSLLSYGDISILSFHATKLFHTGEGGAVVSTESKLIDLVNLLKRFGHNGEDEYLCCGTNAKMSELHAAMGLSVLPLVKSSIAQRKKISDRYDEKFKHMPIATRAVDVGVEYNYSYYPVTFESESTMMSVYSCLKERAVYPRRYFYPSLNLLPYLEDFSACPKSESISSRVLCLPMSHQLSEEEVDYIIDGIKIGLKL